jgi:hypothetical protein
VQAERPRRSDTFARSGSSADELGRRRLQESSSIALAGAWGIR